MTSTLIQLPIIRLSLASTENAYSLYSTATQNTWRRGLALGTAPDARILRWRYQHVGIFWRYLTLKFASPPTPIPDASQWNIGGIGSSGVGHVYFMYISRCLCIIFRVGYAKISRRKGSFQWNMGLCYISGVGRSTIMKCC